MISVARSSRKFRRGIAMLSLVATSLAAAVAPAMAVCDNTLSDRIVWLEGGSRDGVSLILSQPSGPFMSEGQRDEWAERPGAFSLGRGNRSTRVTSFRYVQTTPGKDCEIQLFTTPNAPEGTQPLSVSAYFLVPKDREQRDPLMSIARSRAISMKDTEYLNDGQYYFRDDLARQWKFQLAFVPMGSRGQLAIVGCVSECRNDQVQSLKRAIIDQNGGSTTNPVRPQGGAQTSSRTEREPPLPSAPRPTATAALEQPGRAAPPPNAAQQAPARTQTAAERKAAEKQAALLKPKKVEVNFYDPGSGNYIPGGRIEARLAPNCNNRDGGAGRSNSSSATTEIEYLPANDAPEPGCLVLKPAGDTDDEFCIKLPPAEAKAATEVKNARPIPVFLKDGRANAMPVCPDPDPYTVVFERPASNNGGGQPYDAAEINAIAPRDISLNGAPIVFKGDRFTISLKPRQIRQLSEKTPVANLGPDIDYRTGTIVSAAREVHVGVELKVVDLAGLKFDFRQTNGEPSRSCYVKVQIPDELRGRGFDQSGELRGALDLQEQSGGPMKVALHGARGAVFLRVPNQGTAAPLLEHVDERSREDCYFSKVALDADELRVGTIKRTVGKPRPNLLAVMTSDPKSLDLTTEQDAVLGAYNLMLDVVNRLSTKRIGGKFYQISALSTKEDGKPEQVGKDGAQLLVTSKFGPLEQALANPNQANVAVRLDDLGRMIETMLKSEGNSDPKAQAHVVYAGRVFAPTETACFAGAGQPGYFSWMGDTRSLLILSMISEGKAEQYLSRENFGNAVRPSLVPTELSGLYECVHTQNSTRAKQYVLKVPEVLRGADKARAVKFLEGEAAKLFGLQ